MFVYGPQEPLVEDSYDVNSLPKTKEFLSLALPGDTARVELIETENLEVVASDKPDFLQITRIGHQYRTAAEAMVQPQSCELDASCYPEWSDTATATALINYSTQEAIYYCSGSLINNSTGDFSPLFLTAYHCGIDATVAPSASVTWDYRAQSCGGFVNPGETHSGAARFLAASSEADATLLEVVGIVPQGITYPGWNIALPDMDSPVVGIHYPEASWRRIVFGSVIADDPTRPTFHHLRYNNGMAEPGSSGSPLLNSNHQILGQLWGGNASCTLQDGDVYYGKLSVALPALHDANGSNYLENGLGDDRFGDISSRDKAVQVQAGLTDNLILRMGHDDWFRLTVPSNKLVTLNVVSELGPLMRLYKSGDSTLLSSTADTWVNESQGAVDFDLQATSLANVPRNYYGLNITFADPVPATIFSYANVGPSYNSVGLANNIQSPWSTSYWLEWGTDPNLSAWTETEHRSRFLFGDNFQIDGLQPDTTYYFRGGSQNVGGVAKSTIHSFHTQLFPPLGGYFPANGANSVWPVSVYMNWSGGGPYDVYFGSDPNPPHVATIPVTQYGNYSAGPVPLGATRYWRVTQTHNGILESSPVMVMTMSAPKLGASVPSLELGNTIVGQTVQKTFVITNVGNWSELHFSGWNISDGFAQSNDCPAALSFMVNQCHVTVTAGSRIAGVLSGTLNVSQSDVVQTLSIPITANVFDIQLNDPRPTRSHRGTQNAILAGQAAAYQVSLAPSVPVNASAVMSCGGLPAGVSCQVQPAVVDLSGGAQDVDVIISVAGHAQRVQTVSAAEGRASRLHGGATTSAETHYTRNIHVNVTATVGGAVRTVQVPVTISY